jgi:hypothetical protein
MESGNIKLIETILQDHITRYPRMQIQDLYKLLHQAALGSEHAVLDPESAWLWLARELGKMGDGIMESRSIPFPRMKKLCASLCARLWQFDMSRMSC